MKKGKTGGLDYGDRAVKEEILIRQRRDMWTPEQIASLAGHFRLKPGMSLLDAGCGYGYSLRTFGPYCMPRGRLVGVDREPELLETAVRLAKNEGLGEAATFQAGDIYGLPFDRNTFDVVMVQVVLCHLDEPQRALDELIRVTRRGGCIAVFDNAVGGCPWGWDSTDHTTVKQKVRRCEQLLAAREGRKKLGRGDWSVGLYIPAWMEARGLRDVDARVNERVRWIAPPYRSAGQKGTFQHTREQCDDNSFSDIHIRNTAEELRAAGMDERMIASAVRSARRRERRFREAVTDGNAAFVHGGSFWCTWGFKP
jgi:ubiquinone/menaquinone biosynthesis C-methylase UbiE